MAGAFARIPERENVIVISVAIHPSSADAYVGSVQRAAATEYPLTDPPAEGDTNTMAGAWEFGTNAAEGLMGTVVLSRPTDVDRAFEYAVTHYDDVLRKLAD